MIRRAFSTALVGAALCLGAQHATAQTTCSDSVVLSRGHLDWSGYYGRGPMLVQRLQELAWRSLEGARPLALGLYGLHGAYDSVLAGMRVHYPDTTIAQALAIVMSGESHGFLDAETFVAASLYSAWHLPPEPAMAVFADPYLAAASRLAALYALYGAWSTPRVQSLEIAAFCDLAAAATAFVSMRTGERNPDRDFLPDDQLEFLSGLMFAAQEPGGEKQLRPSVVIPPSSPLAAYLARRGL